MKSSRFFCVGKWESAHAHGRLSKLEGRILRSHGLLCLHAEPTLCLAAFGTTSAIDAHSAGAVAISSIYRTITGDRRVPDYGLHGVLRVSLCGINGTRDLVVQLTGNAPTIVACTMLQPILDQARVVAKTCMRASLSNEKAKSKRKVRMEFVAAIHFMRNRGWEKVIDP